MGKTHFNGSAHVELQGERALTYLSREQNYAEYQVNGFDEPAILLRDYRPDGLAALDEILTTGKLETFAPKFNSPAQVLIQDQDSGDVLIELFETSVPDPDYRLWIAIGIRDHIPVYDYVLDFLVPWEDDNFAFLALYRRHTHHQGELVFSAALSVAI
jgi:hypothetical protein